MTAPAIVRTYAGPPRQVTAGHRRAINEVTHGGRTRRLPVGVAPLDTRPAPTVELVPVSGNGGGGMSDSPAAREFRQMTST